MTTPEPEDFIPDDDPRFAPPPTGEPVPQPPPEGATDAGMDGVDVTDEYVDGDGRLLASALAAVAGWPAVYAKAKSYLGAYPPGRVRENVNDFTQAYYGNNTVAAWCFIFIWYVLNSVGLAGLIGGKKAYVPYIRNISGYKAGHSGVLVGAITAVNSFNHIGFCVRVGGGTFDLLSGNSTSGSSSDAITVKRYSTSYISGFVNLTYPTSPTPTNGDDVLGLKLNDKGEAVKGLQTLLVYAGQGDVLGKSYIDGVYGKATAEAVRRARMMVGSKGEAGSGDKITGWAWGELYAAMARQQSRA